MNDTDNSAVPMHVGLILDGNRRWANDKGLPAMEGHRQGAETLKEVARAGFKRGVKFISAYVFSTENWKRTKDEVKFLMSLVLRLVDKDLEKLHQDGIKIVIVGSRYGLSQKIVQAIDKAEARTRDNQKGVLALCFNYGGQAELVDAVKDILQARVGHLEITEQTITDHLYHPELPPLDMVIRTSGEKRLSNFMMWRAQYAELAFVDKHWPDFTGADLNAAIDDYGDRKRRFGK